MFSVNDWFIYFEALDKITCDKIRNLAKDKWKLSEIGNYAVDKSQRISDTVWSEDQWIYDTIWPYMVNANEEAGWKYDITNVEVMQITRYQKGGFYYFHRDGKGDHLSVYKSDNEYYHGCVRKLSMTILLNDDYEGGEFQFASYKEEKCEISTPDFSKTGSIVVFPSDMEHRVTSVTKGTRYSLVVWFLGPPFK